MKFPAWSRSGLEYGAYFWVAHFQKNADKSNLLTGSIWNNERHENDTCKFGFNNTEKK